MREGRKGYYQRTQAVDKTSTMSVQLHDSHQDLGNAAASSKIYQTAAKAVAPAHEAIDAIDLPFFQLSRNPMSNPYAYAMTTLPNGAMISNVAAASAPMATPTACLKDEPKGSDSEAEQTHENVAACNPLAALKAALPTHSREQAAAKAAAKSAAKSVSNNSNKGTGPRKRKGQDDIDDEPTVSKPKSKEPKILRLETTCTAREELTSKRLEADTKLLNEYCDRWSELKKKSLSSIKDTEQGVNDSLKAASKDMKAFIDKMKGKHKSLKRRQNSDTLRNDIQALIDEVKDAVSMVDELSNNTATQETYQKMTKLDVSWCVSVAMYKRAFKSIVLQCLKFRDWPAFRALRDQIYHQIGMNLGDVFYQSMVSDLIQRLLRALPPKALHHGS